MMGFAADQRGSYRHASISREGRQGGDLKVPAGAVSRRAGYSLAKA
jgi:hypothetical protein